MLLCSIVLVLLLVLENSPTIGDEDENDDDQCYRAIVARYGVDRSH